MDIFFTHKKVFFNAIYNGKKVSRAKTMCYPRFIRSSWQVEKDLSELSVRNINKLQYSLFFSNVLVSLLLCHLSTDLEDF